MRNAKMILMLGAAALAAGACGREQAAEEQNIAANGGAQVDPGAEFETLPADESSTTPSAELQNGFVAGEDENTAAANAQ